MRVKIIFIVLLLFLSNSTIIAQIKVGEKIPDSPIEALLQAPKLKIDSWKDLDGKWIFIEFWATWCAPCIEKIPKINSLQEELLNENIQFISISPESPEIVKRFLKRKSILGWIGVDSDQSFINAFEVVNYPTTVLINPDGIVHSYLNLYNLNKYMILNEMRKFKDHNFKDYNVKHGKKNVGIGMKSVESKDNRSGVGVSKTTSTTNMGSDSIHEVTIEKTDLKGGFIMRSPNGLESNSISLSKLISIAYNISEFYVTGDEDILASRYNVKIKLPNGKESLEKVLKLAIISKFNLNIETEKTSVVAYELIAPQGVTKNLYESKKGTKRKVSSARGIIAVSGAEIDGFFIRTLENLLETKIFNKTGLTGIYDFNFYWNEKELKSIIKALEEQLGLMLIKKNIDTNVLVVKTR